MRRVGPVPAAFAALILIALSPPAHAGQRSFGPELQGIKYPWPVRHFAFSSQGEATAIRYMDVSSAGAPNGKAAHRSSDICRTPNC
jgi:hypothetical protein